MIENEYQEIRQKYLHKKKFVQSKKSLIRIEGFLHYNKRIDHFFSFFKRSAFHLSFHNYGYRLVIASHDFKNLYNICIYITFHFLSLFICVFFFLIDSASALSNLWVVSRKFYLLFFVVFLISILLIVLIILFPS